MKHLGDMGHAEAADLIKETVRTHGLLSVLAMISCTLPQGMGAERDIINEASSRIIAQV